MSNNTVLYQVDEKVETIVKKTVTYSTGIEGITIKTFQHGDNKMLISVNGRGVHSAVLKFIKPGFFQYLKNNDPFKDINKLNSFFYKEKEYTLEKIAEWIHEKDYIFLYTRGRFIFNHLNKIVPYKTTKLFNQRNFNVHKIKESFEKSDMIKLLSFKEYGGKSGSEMCKMELLISSELLNLQYQKYKDRKYWSTNIYNFMSLNYLTNDNDYLNILKYKYKKPLPA